MPSAARPFTPRPGQRCPRCRYRLRGLSSPRCPECGLELSDEVLALGWVRENRPTWLDRADLWQPHALLGRSLVELWHGLLRPGWIVRQLDLAGPLPHAAVMLSVGLAWAWALVGVIAGGAVLAHCGCSPAAALETGWRRTGPQLVALGLVAALPWLEFATRPRVLGLATTTWRARLRVAAWWLPTHAASFALPAALALVVSPDARLVHTLLVLFPAPWALLALGRSGMARGGIVLSVLAFAASAAIAWLGALYLPPTLDPPLSVYL